MKVKIRYCGQLKQAAGCAAEEVDPGGELSAQELIASVASRHGEPLSAYLLDESGRLRATVLAFVNEEQVDWEAARPLIDGDELVFMSAIAGG
jgi:molybdopterin converting factor small subunit